MKLRVLSIMPKIPEITFGKVHLGFLRPEYSGSPLEVVHLSRLEYSDRNSPIPFWQTLIWEFGKGIKSGKSNSYWLARFNRKMLFHFPLIHDRSVWHNGKHP